MSRLAVITATVAMLSGSSSAHAVPLLNGFGGPTGYGLAEHCVHPSDDGSWSAQAATGDATPTAVDLRGAFPEGINWFGQRLTTMFVNVNGNVTFRAPLASPIPVPPSQMGVPMMAPFWADADTRGGGQPARNNVCFHIEPGRVVVTWDGVQSGAPGAAGTNRFQLVITTSYTCTSVDDLNVEYRYARCDWVEGVRGGPALVGFDAGDRRNWVMLPMSRSAEVRAVCETSNVPGGAPGLWRFQVRGSRDGIFQCIPRPGVECAVPDALGVCAQGTVSCAGTCTPRGVRGARVCDGRDHDCDGVADDDDALCAPGETCRRGRCLPRCGAQRPCPAGLSCDPRGACVEDACASVRCDPGEVCRDGRCGDACTGVRCPRSQRCADGRCRDLCEDFPCPSGELCELDPTQFTPRCVVPCQCRPCTEEQACAPDGHCVDRACREPCPTGADCVGGRCIDRCTLDDGARPCAPEEVCARGRCVPRSLEIARDGVDAGIAPWSVPEGGCACGVPRAPRGGAWRWCCALALVRRRRRRARVAK